jgi:hypothetical protein
MFAHDEVSDAVELQEFGFGIDSSSDNPIDRIIRQAHSKLETFRFGVRMQIDTLAQLA